ncbi:hypothetical protein BGW80DRAFT_1256426 [Lactifluus volemus]|nr:hypothetical protein BGW80DRAFT_1256426 [Lactifluus volemus]
MPGFSPRDVPLRKRNDKRFTPDPSWPTSLISDRRKSHWADWHRRLERLANRQRLDPWLESTLFSPSKGSEPIHNEHKNNYIYLSGLKVSIQLHPDSIMDSAYSGRHPLSSDSVNLHMIFYVPKFIKVGYAGSNCPEHVFPSVIGRPILRAEERVGDAVIKDIMVGDEAAALPNYLQKLKVRVDPAGRKDLTEPPMNPRANRQRMCQFMFEEYGFHGVRLDIAWWDVTRYLVKLLLMRGYDLDMDTQLAEETTTVVESYILPDGRTIKSAAVDICAELYKHIVFSSRSSMYPGLPSLLEKEMKQLTLRAGSTWSSGVAILADIMKAREEFWV